MRHVDGHRDFVEVIAIEIARLHGDAPHPSVGIVLFRKDALTAKERDRITDVPVKKGHGLPAPVGKSTAFGDLPGGPDDDFVEAVAVDIAGGHIETRRLIHIVAGCNARLRKGEEGFARFHHERGPLDIVKFDRYPGIGIIISDEQFVGIILIELSGYEADNGLRLTGD